MSTNLSQKDQMKVALNSLFLEGQPLTNHILLSNTTWNTLKQTIIQTVQQKDAQITILEDQLKQQKEKKLPKN